MKNIVVGPAIGALRKHIRGQSKIHSLEIQHLGTVLDLIQPVHHDSYFLLNDRDIRHDTRFREQRVQRPSPLTVTSCSTVMLPALGRRPSRPPGPLV